jgi:hypothetical protein
LCHIYSSITPVNMDITPESEIFLQKAVDSFLLSCTTHKLKFDRSDCLDCFSKLSTRLHELIGDRMAMLQVVIDFSIQCESGL